ncbi:MAG: GNAT family N-acetyltransferase [Planctomycetota bacterium]|nr:GNAT family N-acetyltransferase [Planctomycetota bacterium]
MPHANHLGQPIGAPLAGWKPPPHPPREALAGRSCRLEPLEAAKHARELFDANALDADGALWTYLPYGPFESFEAYEAWVKDAAAGADPLFFAIVDTQSGKAAGVASLMRIFPALGSIEVGHINYAPPLQQTVAASESMYLLMKRAFELGYRRYEWKCDAFNAKSRQAAQRLGFSYEGLFRQHTIYKGRTRDTAWYSVIDSEWPALREAFERWLDPANFDAQGRQLRRLSELTGPLLKQRG